MNSIKKIILLISMLMIEQQTHCAAYRNVTPESLHHTKSQHFNEPYAQYKHPAQSYYPQQDNSYSYARSAAAGSASNREEEAIKLTFRTLVNKFGSYSDQNLDTSTIKDLVVEEAHNLLDNEIISYNELFQILQSLRLEYERARNINQATILYEARQELEQFQENIRNRPNYANQQTNVRFSNLMHDTSRLTNRNFMPETDEEEIEEEITEQSLADKLIEQSYFSPEMQYAVLACVEEPFEVNVVTGKVQNIPVVADIIAHCNASTIDAKTKLNALRAALEAVHIARFYAKLNVAYDNPAYVFFAPTLSSNRFLMPSLDENLETAFLTREQGIQAVLRTTEGYNSLSSWIPTDLVNMFTITARGAISQDKYQSKLEFNANIQNIEDTNNFVTIAGNTLKDLIKNFDYKQKVNIQEAANLLFKQCFIAQQPFPTDDWALYCTPLGHTVSASNYIFDRFEVTRKRLMKQNNSPFLQVNTQSLNVTHAKNIDELCNIISQSANTDPHSPLQAHLLFLRIRKAIQTAMYIANKNSNFYLGYILPPAITKYLDGIVKQLITYDQKLSELCKNQQLGATKDDLLRDKMWNNITGVATGLGIIGITATAIDYSYGAGTSAKIAENSAENATYYTGKVIAGAAALPLQSAANLVNGTINIASGVKKGAKDLASDAYNVINQASAQKNEIIAPSISPTSQNNLEKNEISTPISQNESQEKIGQA